MRDVTLVTGASMGIGEALARVFAADGRDLALTARSLDKLEALADAIAATGRPRPLVIAEDLGEPGAADRIALALSQAGARATGLINNAGFGLNGATIDLPRGEQVSMVDLNIRALLDLTLRLAPDIAAARGAILNVASIAAFQPGPGMAVYYATKAFVLSFSQALAYELKPRGVTVTALCPGITASDFQRRAGIDAALFKLLKPMDAMTVAKAGLAGLKRGDRVVIPGLLNRIMASLSPLTPSAISLALIGKLQAKRGGSKE
jgi:short-subunit dehydrogenase